VTELEFLPLALEHRGEGICIQLRLGPYWLLLDCGLKDISSLLNYAEQTPWVALLCSHAHPDHARGIRPLHELLPDLPVYSSEVTARLLPLAWQDQPEELASLCIPMPWGKSIQIQPNLFIQILPAGHLPGAACFAIRYVGAEREYKVLYTGDFFLSNSRLVDGLPLESLREQSPDVLIIEGSLGAKRYPHRRSQENQFAATLSRELAAGKSVILPLPKLGTAQEVLMLLRSHHYFTGKDIDIWVDDEIALVCDRYLQLIEHLPSSVQNFAQNQPLFWDRKVKPRVGRLSELLAQTEDGSATRSQTTKTAIDTSHDRHPQETQQRQRPKRSPQASNDRQARNSATSSKQLSKPAAKHLKTGNHASHAETAKSVAAKSIKTIKATKPAQPEIAESARSPQSKTKPFILLVDYESDWQTWLEKFQCEWVAMLPEAHETDYLPWRSPFPYQTYLLTEHSDVSGTTQLIHNLKPQHVIFVHGKPSDLADLANLPELSNRYHIHCPAIGKRLELPVNDALHAGYADAETSSLKRKFPTLSPYEGELAQRDATVMLTLPAEITSDPRWLDFADTGLIEARWQGEELIIRGISQRELMIMSAADSPNPNLYCCGNCRFFQKHYCHNPESPLYGLKVSRDGYCQVFEAIDTSDHSNDDDLDDDIDRVDRDDDQHDKTDDLDHINDPEVSATGDQSKAIDDDPDQNVESDGSEIDQDDRD
jgi:Cft2 family RNA processing exonuclease